MVERLTFFLAKEGSRVRVPVPALMIRHLKQVWRDFIFGDRGPWRRDLAFLLINLYINVAAVLATAVVVGLYLLGRWLGI